MTDENTTEQQDAPESCGVTPDVRRQHELVMAEHGTLLRDLRDSLGAPGNRVLKIPGTGMWGVLDEIAERVRSPWRSKIALVIVPVAAAICGACATYAVNHVRLIP